MESIDNNKKNLQDGVVRSIREPSEINDRLFIAMKMAGYRQISKFAETCGYCRPYMSGIIHKRFKPTLEQAEVIANKLNLRVQDIFEISELRIPELDNLIKKHGVEDEEK